MPLIKAELSVLRLPGNLRAELHRLQHRLYSHTAALESRLLPPLLLLDHDATVTQTPFDQATLRRAPASRLPYLDYPSPLEIGALQVRTVSSEVRALVVTTSLSDTTDEQDSGLRVSSATSATPGSRVIESLPRWKQWGAGCVLVGLFHGYGRDGEIVARISESRTTERYDSLQGVRPRKLTLSRLLVTHEPPASYSFTLRDLAHIRFPNHSR